MSVWAVIPHYGPAAATASLVDVLLAASVVPDRIVVVDNQGGLDLDTRDRVSVLRPGFNTGYGMAVERAAEMALAGGADWLWALNNDARPAADCLERLLEAGAADPLAGILSPLIRYRAGGDVWYAGGSVSARALDVRHLREPQGRAPYPTGFITGCAPLLRGALVRELAPLDDGFFMYYEDVDWSLRALDAGWRLLVVPAAELVHDVRRERGRRVFSDAATYYMVRNRLLVARRHAGAARPVARGAAPAAARGRAPAVAGRLTPAGVAGLAAPVVAAALWGVRQAAKSRSTGEARRRLAACCRGVRDGLAGRRGPCSRFTAHGGPRDGVAGPGGSREGSRRRGGQAAPPPGGETS